jgi:hypothetical protein
MIKKFQITIPLLVLLISCSGDVSSQSSAESISINTFTVVFDSREGSAVPSQTFQPNSFITPPSVAKEGHTLEGWYTSINEGVTLDNKWDFFSNRVNFNFTLYAKWMIAIERFAWVGYGTVVTLGATSASIAYVNPTPADLERNSQLTLTAPFDQTKEAVEFDFTGKADDNYLFKVEGPSGAAELMVKATGADQKVIVPVVQLNATQRAALNLFVIFARTDGSTGTIVVRDWKYVDVFTPLPPEWRAEGGATVTMDGPAMTFTYTSRDVFYDQSAQIDVVGFDGSKSSVTISFTGEAGHEYMFKFEYPGHTNDVELKVIATGNAQTAVMDLTALSPEIRATFNNFIVFNSFNPQAGSITINSWN